MWYPEAVPGSHQGACAASRAVDLSQSYKSSRVIGCSQPETPEVCEKSWRTWIPALPRAANSGQYLATVASRSSSPRSTSTSAASAVIVLVVEKTLAMVFSVHGAVRASSAQPPHRSATVSPSMLTASEAPRSSPDSSLAANRSRRGSKRALHVPPSGVGWSFMGPPFRSRGGSRRHCGGGVRSAFSAHHCADPDRGEGRRATL